MGASLLQAAKRNVHVCVVGAGVFGAWSAYYLRRAGYRVTLIDQYGPAGSRASSGGETRIIRCAYGPDEIYTRMAARSLSLWSGFFLRSGHSFLLRTGVLWMTRPGDEYAQQSRQTLRAAAVPFQDLTYEELQRLYPQIRFREGAEAIFEPNSGALLARRATQAVVDQFIDDGGEYRHTSVERPAGSKTLGAIRTSDGESIAADAFVFACGPWMSKVFPDLLSSRIFVTRQEVVFFGVPAGDRRFEPPLMPVWIDFSENRGIYGFPDIENRGFKVAFDVHGPPFDPDTGDRVVTPEGIAAVREYLAERFPALAKAPVEESRVCQYENTSNGDFLIDRHPEMEDVWLAGGGSGHGFKHGPAVGEYVAARVAGSEHPPIEPRFSFTAKDTVQKRAVY